MIRPSRRPLGWPDLLILLAGLAFAIGAIRWADRHFLALQPPIPNPQPRPPSWPGWLWELYHPSQRLAFDFFWIPVAATLAAGAILARDRRAWTRRGLRRPGTLAMALTFLVGGAAAAHQFIAPPIYVQAAGLAYNLSNALGHRVPGAIIGAWVVAGLAPRRRRRPIDGRERLARVAAWSWMVNIALMVVQALIFG